MNKSGKRANKYTLSPLTHSKGKQKEFIGFDVETHTTQNTFLMGSFYWKQGDKKKYATFYSREKMIKYVLRRIKFFRSRWIVATNLEFDFTVLFKDTKYWNAFDLLFRDSQLIAVSEDTTFCNKKTNYKKMQFVDTMNYAPYSVAKWGKILNIQKLERPSSWKAEVINGLETLVPRKPKDTYEYFELNKYNIRDCEVSCNAMYLIQKGIRQFNGTLKITIASSCFDIFRRGFMIEPFTKEQYVLDQENPDKTDVLDLIYSAYYGGRTEVFKRGEFENVYYYDINSLYPSVMREALPLPQSIQKPQKPLMQYITLYEGVSVVTITAPHINKPFLPVRHDDRLIFPIGTFKGAYTHVELRKAISLGYTIHDIHDQIYYTKKNTYFKKYIDTMYKHRLIQKKNGDVLESITKLFMNSLYGGFGMKWVTETKLKRFEDMTNDDLNKLGIYEVFQNDYVMTRKVKSYDGKRKYPIIACYVTALARTLMYDYLDNESVIYTDTDSIMTEDPLPESMISDKLGMMKCEGIYTKGIFIKPKMYALLDNDDWTVKIKGISHATYDDFIGSIKGGVISKLKFNRMRESIRRGITMNAISVMDKSLDMIDKKRVWESSEILETQVNSTPLILGDYYGKTDI